MKIKKNLSKETVITEQSPLLRVPTETEIKERRIQEALNFFNLLYLNSSSERYGYLWLKKGDAEKLTISFQVSDEHNRHEMAKFAIQYSDDGYDVYCGLCTTDKSLKKHERAKNSNVTGKTAVWCDIDIQGGEHQGDKYPPDFDTAKNFLSITPSILVNSGYGLHGYCFFDEVQTITDENRDMATQLNKDFIMRTRKSTTTFEHSTTTLAHSRKELP